MRTFNSVRLPLRAVAIAMAFSLAALSTAAVAADDGMKSSKAAKQADIVDTAVAAGQFKTLAAALTAADLVATLKGAGPFTVFAPTDEAFAKVPKDVLEGLLADKEKLAAVLKYHVVAGKVMAADVVKLDSAKTLQGTTVAIDATGGVKVNDAKVIKADIKCKNGVIHVIDSVLLPPADEEGAMAEKDIIDTGATLNSMQTVMAGDAAHIGPTTDYAIYHEMGTSRMAARPFLRPALAENKDAILRAVADAVRAQIRGRR